MPAGTASPRRRYLHDALLILLALVLFAGFCSLGTWQLQRRTWKLDLISHVEQQLARAPVTAPGRAAWPALSPNDAYLPVKVTGKFLHDRETFVQALTSHGSGYWVLTPLRSEQGFVVLVNRGFVDPAHRDPATRRAGQPAQAVEVSGLLRLSEPARRTLQVNDPGTDRWYSRDVAAIGAARELPAGDLAPYFIDADARPNTGGWPIGGLTVIRFRNTHLGYAITWYSLALMTVAGGWIVFRRRDPERGQESGGGPQSG